MQEIAIKLPDHLTLVEDAEHAVAGEFAKNGHLDIEVGGYLTDSGNVSTGNSDHHPFLRLT